MAVLLLPTFNTSRSRPWLLVRLLVAVASALVDWAATPLWVSAKARIVALSPVISVSAWMPSTEASVVPAVALAATLVALASPAT